MGSLYKRTFTTSDGETRERPTFWLKYYQNGRAIRESTGTTKETVARRMLRLREGDVERGIPVNPRMDRVTFDEAARDVVNDYTANAKKSLRVLHHRIAHLRPFFGGGRRMSGIRVSDIRAYIVDRQRSFIVTGAADQQQQRHPSNGLINRELTTLKRMFSLAVQAEKLARKPHIPLLAEAPARAGFFDRELIDAVCRHLPSPIAAVIRFAFLTGWRVDSEVVTIRWANIDWPGESIRLEAGTTKGGEPRVFPFTDELRALLQAQWAEHEALRRTGTICPFVFHRAGKPRASSRAGASPAGRPAVRVGFRTTSGARRSATSSAPGCRGRPQWRWSDTRPSRFTAATPSSTTRRAGRRPRSSTSSRPSRTFGSTVAGRRRY